MLTDPACPDCTALRELLLGRASDAEAEGLEAHLAECPRCLELLRTMRVEDTLTDALRSGENTPVIEADEGLIARLCGSPGVATVVQAPPEAEAHAFLAPAGGPGELGRLGPYRVLKTLGAGGMGIVLHAEDSQLGRPVALKVMRPALAANLAARQRFLREARAMAAVKSDHVITIYQVGEDRGIPFLAMELLQGESMDQRLARGHEPGLAELVRLGREMAQGLAAAHERGLVHRDVKPGNVWLEAPVGEPGGSSPRYRAKLLDFGLARAAGEDVNLTTSGAVIGTPAFMAPEQARGEKVDHRADLFSLGVVLYRLSTGEMPFRGDTTMAVLTALAVENPRPVREVAPQVPPALADLIMRLLAKNPADRPQTAKDVVTALQAVEGEASPTAHESRPSRRGLRLAVAVAVLLAVLGPLAWFFGPTVVRLATNKGELVVEVDDPDVEVVLKPNGVLLQSGKEQTLVLPAGDGSVEVRDPAKDWALVTREFSLKRGGKEVVLVRSQDVAQARAARAKGAAPPDKDKPFVVVRKGGERRAFKTFADALAGRGEGEAIEVYGNGPFPVPAAEVDGKGLVLRATPGYRPVFVAQVEEGARRPWLAVLGGEVLVEGCDFHGDTVFTGWLFDSGPEPRPAAPWTFRNCRFWVNGARGLMACAAPRLAVEDCLIVGTFGEALTSLALRSDLAMTNNLVHLAGPPAVVAAGNQTLRLTNNYFESGRVPLLRPPTDEAPARPITVVAEGNVFAGLLLLGDEGGGMPSEKVTRAQVKWQGKENLYVRSGRPFVSFSQDKRELRTLNDWDRFWGQEEPGSAEVPWLGLQYGAVAVADPAGALRMARQETEALCGRLGAAGRDVGPEWDLVGPGEAYVRARERASGKLLPGSNLRPEAPAGGPFVLLRGREAAAGYATLQAALDAARPGDAVEVRGDGLFKGANLQAPERGGGLTLRAAPGYRPALETSLNLNLPRADVEIEGLMFLESHLTGDFARLTMRNCALHDTKEPWTLGCDLRAPGQAARFLGCTFNAGPDCRLGPGQSALFENCVVSRIQVHARADDDCETAFRRCLCWAAGLGNGTVACDLNAKARPRVRADDSVFVGGGVLTGSAAQARWSGRHNVYGLTYGFAIGQPFYTLEAWQKRWDGDRDSRVTPSPFLEPRLWRLLPGQAKRPDGKDYGADVDRVARPAAP